MVETNTNVCYTIYCHVFPNGKRYIGVTKMKLKERWNNGNGYKTCPEMEKAIREFGWENVKHEVLDYAYSEFEADKKEREYIDMFNTTNIDYGYNVLPGGNVATNDVTDEMRIKLGNGWRGKKRTDGDKRMISEGVKKKFERPESNGHFGMKHSEETKRAMSEAHKKSWDKTCDERGA